MLSVERVVFGGGDGDGRRVACSMRQANARLLNGYLEPLRQDPSRLKDYIRAPSMGARRRNGRAALAQVASRTTITGASKDVTASTES